MNDRLTVAEYLNRWLYEVAKQRTRPMTWRGYEHLVRLHILPTLGRVRLAKLTPQHVHSLVTQKVREGRLSPRTIQYMHSVLRASLKLVQGVHPRVVMETLGHSQISLTMNTHSHVLPALQREAADRMEAVLSGP